MSDSTISYWAITGKLCGSEDDPGWSYGPCTLDEAKRLFRIDVRGDYGLPDLNGEPDPIRENPQGVTVYINCVFRSDSPIYCV